MAFRQITTLPKLKTEQEKVLCESLRWEVAKLQEILESLSQKKILSIKSISSRSRTMSFGKRDSSLTADETKLYNKLKNWDGSN
jgi:hypothetical protein